MRLEFRKFMESVPPGIKRIVIFDFDDTLVFTPTPEEGIPNYEKTTGKPWYIRDKETAELYGYPPNFRRTGWWSNPATLKPPVFEPHPEKLNQEVAKAFQSFRDDAQTYVVVMTGRTANAEKRVREILGQYNIHPDEYFLKGQKALLQDPNYPRTHDTFQYKEYVILNKLMTQEIQTVEIFDDREEHIPRFVELGRNLRQKWPNLKSVVIHDVRQNKNYNL